MKEQALMLPEVAVIGAGVIGLCNALTLQRAGYRVTLFDPHPPGSQTSSGNASYLATELISPLATPETLKQAPGLWLDPHGPVATPLAYFHKALPWLLRFAREGSHARSARGRQALYELNRRALPAWRRLLSRHGLEHHLIASGYLQLWQQARGHVAAERHAAYLQDWNIKAELIDGGATAELEPALAGRVAHAIFYPDACQMNEPYRLSQSLYRSFIELGGHYSSTRVSALVPAADRVELVTEAGCAVFARAVLCAGVWSAKLLSGLGMTVPLEAERGYHITWKCPRPPLSRPIGSAERHMVMTPLADGIRTVGFSEWGGLDVPFKHKRIETLRRHSCALLPVLAGQGWPQQEWMGFRPTLPDSLPVIGRHEQYPSLLLAFGHSHLGLTQAAITAEVILSLLQQGKAPPLDITPYRLGRFGTDTK
ncbi:NAD(P)/FAD-dependent oxidoreductase [Zobellella sp. DQSA1]|uniref:NAD(P)/FAD-dependent oxidoreductase n=1 Tax=Zobellella sp. DQSA1 TaxID=3342386 RepID=UPI0035C09B87